MNKTGSYEIEYNSQNMTNTTVWWKHSGHGKENIMSSEFSFEWETKKTEPEQNIEIGLNFFTQLANLVVQNELSTNSRDEHQP